MILIGIINTIYAIVYVITSPLRLLPDVTLPTNYLNSIASANSYISPFNMIIPINTILDIINLFVLIEIAYLTYKFIMWLIRRIPTQS